MPPSTRGQRFRRRGFLTLSSAAIAFWVIQALLGVTMELSPSLRDPEFAQKLARLQKQVAAQPERPLLLIAGSSRSSCGLQPSAMPSLSLCDGSQPIIFNLALTGYGPVQQVNLLWRLNRAGIRPHWILAEIMPVLLHQQPDRWSQGIPAERLDWRDLSVIGPYLLNPGDWQWRWAKSRALPAWCSRFQLMNWVLPGWLDTAQRHDGAWTRLDDDGWLPMASLDAQYSADERRRCAREQYAAAFNCFCIGSVADQALREFVQMAKDGATVGFFLMPEGDQFQSWYPPGARQEIVSYLHRLTDDTDAPVYDTTTWCAEDDFADSHHLLASSATMFSKRFGQEVVEPFLNAHRSDNTHTATSPDRLRRALR